MGLGHTLFPVSSAADAFAIWITSAEFVGIGIATPDGTLHVHTGSAGTVTAVAAADDLVVESSGNTGMTFLSPNTGLQQIAFGDTDAAADNYIRYNHAGDVFSIAANNLEFFYLVSSFRMGLGLAADGATAPDGKIHVFDGSAGTVTANVVAASFIAEDDTSCGISILTPAASVGGLYFGSPTANDRGRLTYSHSTDVFTLATSSTARVDLSGTAWAPRTNDTMALGTTAARWNNLFTVGASFTGLAIAFINTSLGFFSTAAAAQQVSAANLTNNVTSGGTDDTIANYTDLSIYANDAAAIRNDIYQLARKLKQINDGLRTYGLFT